MAFDADFTTYLVSFLRGMHNRNELILSPKFQRRLVWAPAAKSFFIDTLLRGFPVPPIHLRVTRFPGDDESKLEVIDGQQRLRTVFDFLAGDLRLSRTLDGDWSGKKFAQLVESDRNLLLDRELFAFQYKSVSDRDVLQIFERFNVNSIQLNGQELRNGRFFGHFKQACYALSREYFDFWRNSKVFSDQAIARMLEVEFVSELLVMQQAGLQDKKNSLNDFYGRLDEDWPDRAVEEDKFRTVIDTIVSVLGADLTGSSFTKRPLFYTLYGAIAHRYFGIPGFDAPTPKTALTTEEEDALRAAVTYWTEVLTRVDETGSSNGESAEEAVEVEDLEFVEEDGSVESGGGFTAVEQQFREASTSQTDNVIPRRTRLGLFYSHTFGV
jgi:hypothetical protein